MKTKTPEQIYEQVMNILREIALEKGRWEGIVYKGVTEEMRARARKACDIGWRYIDNIYAANGIKDRKNCGPELNNQIWETSATPVSIYAKDV